MRDPILIALTSAAATGALVWVATWCRGVIDRRKVRRWLRSNTRDSPGESHVETVTLAKGTHLPDERVRRACMSDKRVHRAPGDSDLWSVWRAEPESIYEKREGFLSF